MIPLLSTFSTFSANYAHLLLPFISVPSSINIVDNKIQNLNGEIYFHTRMKFRTFLEKGPFISQNRVNRFGFNGNRAKCSRFISIVEISNLNLSVHCIVNCSNCKTLEVLEPASKTPIDSDYQHLDLFLSYKSTRTPIRQTLFHSIQNIIPRTILIYD